MNKAALSKRLIGNAKVYYRTSLSKTIHPWWRFVKSPAHPRVEGDAMDIAYFRPRKPGPESIIENAVADQIPNLFSNETHSLWAAGAPTIGAGMPDLVIVTFQPQVSVLATVDIPTVHILAYLRVVGCARLDTIIERIGMPHKTTVRCLNNLIDVEAVSRVKDKYSLPPIWRQILQEIVTIEVKVSNWKRAVEQAARNRIFSHRSFIALPESVAKRVRSESVFKQLGVGLISVGDDHMVSVLRRARSRKPRVWKYYYEIAYLLANNNKVSSNGIRCTYR